MCIKNGCFRQIQSSKNMIQIIQILQKDNAFKEIIIILEYQSFYNNLIQYKLFLYFLRLEQGLQIRDNKEIKKYKTKTVIKSQYFITLWYASFNPIITNNMIKNFGLGAPRLFDQKNYLLQCLPITKQRLYS
ncbi:hypothetical protein pb186bvf_012329 [Paramecium bursaria]